MITIKPETVFEMLVEGESLAISRKKDIDGRKFIYLFNQFVSYDEETEAITYESIEYYNFKTPFQFIINTYPWYVI